MTLDSQPLNILAQVRSPFNDIYVIQRENLREMWFRGGGRFFLQSRIDLDRPGDLALIYVRLFLAPLLWNPEPRRVLVIGLGGGTLPRFLHEVYPELNIDVVEIDPRVVQLARQYFDFKESTRLRVFEEDGRAFVQRQREDAYDLVYLDAFKSGSVPFHLKTVEFYREIRRTMASDGLLATNLYGKSNTLKPKDRATLELVFPQATCFEDPDRVATVCVAFGQNAALPEAMYRSALECLPDSVLGHLSWLANVDMIGKAVNKETRGSIFRDDFEATEFLSASRRNNRNIWHPNPPYPIRNSS